LLCDTASEALNKHAADMMILIVFICLRLDILIRHKFNASGIKTVRQDREKPGN
jgi:hypothetical protein